jgi:hypothetical protein
MVCTIASLEEENASVGKSNELRRDVIKKNQSQQEKFLSNAVRTYWNKNAGCGARSKGWEKASAKFFFPASQVGFTKNTFSRIVPFDLGDVFEYTFL